MIKLHYHMPILALFCALSSIGVIAAPSQGRMIVVDKSKTDASVKKNSDVSSVKIYNVRACNSLGGSGFSDLFLKFGVDGGGLGGFYGAEE